MRKQSLKTHCQIQTYSLWTTALRAVQQEEMLLLPHVVSVVAPAGLAPYLGTGKLESYCIVQHIDTS